MPASRFASIDPSRAANIVLAVLLHWAALCASSATGLAQAASADLDRIASNSIEISADFVERNVDARTAVFRGNASAIMGNVSLKAAEISVIYTAIRDERASSDGTPTASLNEAGREVAQIDLKGSVAVTLPFNMQSSSDLASLDVKTQQLTMKGNVLLSQREKSLRGEVLTFNLGTGVARFSAPGAKRNPPIYVPPQDGRATE